MNIPKMTPAQQKRFSELMMRDIASVPFSSSPAMMSAIPPMPRVGIPITSIDDMLDNIERKQNARAEMLENLIIERNNKLFNRDELFRFAYVPFVIAELVWDYADTVIIMAQNIGNPATRRLSRAIRNARTEYDRLRHQYIDESNRKREIENGYVFEEATKQITAQMVNNVRNDIKSEYPELNVESRDLLLAVYQCHITSKALLRYLDRQSVMIAKRVGHSIGKMLPPSYYVMDKLIPEFIGDKPASVQFRETMNKYIEQFANEMDTIGFNDIDENQQQTPKPQTTMTNEDLYNEIQAQMIIFSAELNKNINKGNKAAGVRARKASLELEKLMKQYRKQSVK
jgi:hypothetical protein